MEADEPAEAGQRVPPGMWLIHLFLVLSTLGVTLLGVAGGRFAAALLRPGRPLPHWFPGVLFLTAVAWTGIFFALGAVALYGAKHWRYMPTVFGVHLLLAGIVTLGHYTLWGWIGTGLFYFLLLYVTAFLSRKLRQRVECSRWEPPRRYGAGTGAEDGLSGWHGVSGLSAEPGTRETTRTRGRPRRVEGRSGPTTGMSSRRRYLWGRPTSQDMDWDAPLGPDSAPAAALDAQVAAEMLRRAARPRHRPPRDQSAAGAAVTDPVDCAVFAPPEARPGASLLVQVFAHIPPQAAEAEALATRFDAEARRRGFQALEADVPRGAKLQFELTLPGLSVADAVQSLVWRGRTEYCTFDVTVPENHPPGNVVGTVTASLDSVPIGHVKFILTMLAADCAREPHLPEPLGVEAKRYQKAFVSYASEDRLKVLARVQMLNAVGIPYFQDVLDLDPGVRWERELYRHIDDCDLFLLFWSKAASESEWVLREARYALERKGGDELKPPEIRPVILEGPPIVPPPKELAHLHFSDRLIYFLKAEASA